MHIWKKNHPDVKWHLFPIIEDNGQLKSLCGMPQQYHCLVRDSPPPEHEQCEKCEKLAELA